MAHDLRTIETSRASVPALGFGTWGLDDEAAEACVPVALHAGYRHLDTARIYGNEVGVGRGLAASGIDREEVFVTTKVWWTEARPADVVRSTQQSLRALGLDHVDLLLLHWPAEDVAPLEATLEALAALRERGLTRHIGVSNFPARMLERALDAAPVVTDQVEHHPYLSVRRIEEVCAAEGLFVTAYSPIARGRVNDDDTLAAIAAEHGVDPVRVTLRWLLQRGISPIPRSSDPERIAGNADVFGFTLTDEEMARIDGLARNLRLVEMREVDWDDE